MFAAALLLAGPASASTFWAIGLVTSVKPDPKGITVTYILIDPCYVTQSAMVGEEWTYSAVESPNSLFLLDGEPVSAKEFFVPGRVCHLYPKDGILAAANSRRDGEMMGRVVSANPAAGKLTLRVYAADCEVGAIPGQKQNLYKARTVAVTCGPATLCLLDGKPAQPAEALKSLNSIRYLPSRPQRVCAFTAPAHVWQPQGGNVKSVLGYIKDAGKDGGSVVFQAQRGQTWEEVPVALGQKCRTVLDAWQAPFEQVAVPGRRALSWVAARGGSPAFFVCISDQEGHVSGMIKEVRDTGLVVTVAGPAGPKDVEVALQADAVFTLDGKESKRAEAVKPGVRVRVLAPRSETLEVLTTPFTGKTVEEICAALQAFEGKETLSPEEAEKRLAAAKAVMDLAADGDAKALKAVCEATKAAGKAGDPRKLLGILVEGLFRAGKPADEALTQDVVAALAASIRISQFFHTKYSLLALTALGPAAKNALPVLEDATIAEKLKGIGSNRTLLPEAIKAIKRGEGR